MSIVQSTMTDTWSNISSWYRFMLPNHEIQGLDLDSHLCRPTLQVEMSDVIREIEQAELHLGGCYEKFESEGC